VSGLCFSIRSRRAAEGSVARRLHLGPETYQTDQGCRKACDATMIPTHAPCKQSRRHIPRSPTPARPVCPIMLRLARWTLVNLVMCVIKIEGSALRKAGVVPALRPRLGPLGGRRGRPTKANVFADLSNLVDAPLAPTATSHSGYGSPSRSISRRLRLMAASRRPSPSEVRTRSGLGRQPSPASRPCIGAGRPLEAFGRSIVSRNLAHR
jgi:hypothetical protein